MISVRSLNRNDREDSLSVEYIQQKSIPSVFAPTSFLEYC